MPGYYLTSRADIEVETFDPLPKISFPTIPASLRFPGTLVSLENITYRYTRTSPTILNGITLIIDAGDRLAIAGLNGTGKTTLLVGDVRV